MIECAPGTWETCRISSDQAGLGLVLAAVVGLCLIAWVVARCWKAAGAKHVSSQFSGADWSQDGRP